MARKPGSTPLGSFLDRGGVLAPSIEWLARPVSGQDFGFPSPPPVSAICPTPVSSRPKTGCLLSPLRCAFLLSDLLLSQLLVLSF